jgi:hypothetical protein
MSWLSKLRDADESKAENAKRVRGSLRVAGYCTVVLGVCSVIWVRNAKAEYTNTTLQFGKEMAELTKGRQQEVTKLIFNGQAMYLGSTTSNENPKAVLDRMETYCKANPGQPGADWKDVEKRAADVDDNADIHAGFLRTEEGDRGMVSCFVKSANMKPTAMEAFETFFTTGELGALGELRYTYVARGESGQTLVLTAWTDSKFNLLSMMGEDGKDAPGQDFPEVPRYPNGTRVLSAYPEGMAYGVNVYKTPDSQAKVLAFYDQQMRAQGWKTYDPELKDIGGRGYLKGGVVVTLASNIQPEGHFVSLGMTGVSAQESKLGQK